MFGNNPIRRIEKGDGSKLAVKSVFKTIQGEGPNIGMPAIFIRLGGCNLACKFCDTDFEDFQSVNLTDLIEQVEKLSYNYAGKKSVNLVVITGGEPFRQPIFALCEDLLAKNFLVQIETNGTLYRQLPEKVEIICSPKAVNGKYFPLREDLLSKITAFKFLISTEQIGYNKVPELGQTKFDIAVYVQPMDEENELVNRLNKQLTVEIAINNGYRLSYQIHKELGIE